MENVNNSMRKQGDMELSGIAKLNLRDIDVVQIWDEVSAYIDRHMSQSKGVSIPNFGTFSFVQKKLDIGGANRFVLIQRPVFSLAEKFAQTHGLAYTKYPIAGCIPVHPLNYTAISLETQFSRDQIESCVRHVLAVLNRSVAANRNVEFTFTGIGRLQIRNGKVKMKFFKEFVNQCDLSGKAINDMQNRPNTADSVMSRNESARSQTRNTCVLPRINSRMGATAAGLANHLDSSINISNSCGAMDTIAEENMNSVRIEDDGTSSQSYLAPPVATLFSSEEAAAVAAALQQDPTHQYVVTSTQPPPPPPPPHAAQSHHQSTKFHVPDAMHILTVPNSTTTTTTCVEPSYATTTTTAAETFTSPSSVYLSANEAETVNAILGQHTDQTPPSLVDLSSPPPPPAQLVRPSSKSLIGTLVATPPQPGQSHHHAVSCSHQNAGQELCYLCHQRQKRNVPVYVSEEVKRREKEEAQILSQYQHLMDLDKQLRDEEKRKEQRLDRAKMDAFNLGMSEGIKMRSKERPKTCDLGRSFVFRRRCRTPPKHLKQQDLYDSLSRQIESKRREESAMRQETKYAEKMEQLQLAEELAAQREAYVKEKSRRQRDLKWSLDNQVRNKPDELPRALPDGEVFGAYDAKNEKLAANRARECEAAKFNRERVEQRKREDLLNQLRDQEVDSENIERVKEELRVDRSKRFSRMLDMRRGLETNWSFAVRDKKERETDERKHRMAHDGLLVHEQCDRYRRCAQCQRDLRNYGETNVWRDDRYAAGNRIIV